MEQERGGWGRRRKLIDRLKGLLQTWDNKLKKWKEEIHKKEDRIENAKKARTKATEGFKKVRDEEEANKLKLIEQEIAKAASENNAKTMWRLINKYSRAGKEQR